MSRPAIPPRCALPLPLPSLFCPLPALKEAFDLDLLVAKLEEDVGLLGKLLGVWHWHQDSRLFVFEQY